MTDEQIKAMKQLQRALNKCHSVGLKGGVFDTAFCVWPRHIDPRSNGDDDFFELVERHGGTLTTSMNLDGGAGT